MNASDHGLKLNTFRTAALPKWLCLAIAVLGWQVGCEKPAEKPAPQAQGGEDAGHEHHHDDQLFWQRDDVEQADCLLKLGHHGAQIFAAHTLEPAVAITRKDEGGIDQDVNNAQVFVALLHAGDNTVLAEEQTLVFEPQTAAEPAHYAQAKLQVPADLGKVVIRYRVVLPGKAGEAQYEVPVTIEKH